MILNNRQSSFVFQFPKEFFNSEIENKYKDYYKSLILPYDTISDFMSSTVQQIDFPGWSMTTSSQTLLLGKTREMKNSKPIQDLFTREFTLTFKLTDAFLNYFIMLENALNYLDFNNTELDVFPPFIVLMLNSEGKAISQIEYNKVILKGMSSLKLSYSSNTPTFNTFDATFNYFDFNLKVAID